MCDPDREHEPLEPLGADEYRLDTERVRSFIAAVRERIDAAPSPAEACERIAPLFEQLLSDGEWLPAAYQEPAADSGMGGGIGQWLVFRARDRALAVVSL